MEKETQAENFVNSLLRMTSNEKGSLGIEFKDGSAIDYDIDSCKITLYTAPMTRHNKRIVITKPYS